MKVNRFNFTLMMLSLGVLIIELNLRINIFWVILDIIILAYASYFAFENDAKSGKGEKEDG